MTSPAVHPAYRPDIDGLRALAVLSVVFFHAFPTVMTGGFIGVDVFFVISGYLITGLMLREYELTGTVRVAGFYVRRTRRIFPALILLLLSTLAVGWITLTSNEFKQFGKYMAGGAVFLDNFLFWRDAGYFDNKPEVKPLLHLWSLGVEEQFYLFWPLILGFALKFGQRRWVLALAIVFCGASFFYAQHKIGVDAVGAFYSPVSRMWELLAGGLLVVLQRHRVKAPTTSWTAWLTSGVAREGAAVIGLALVATGLLLIDRTTAFPGLWALLPVAGTVLLIASGPSCTVHRRLLSHPWMVGLGLISYPLYLWHWPLLSFARILHGETPPATTRMVLVLAGVGLAYATYCYIERPIRHSRAKFPHRLALSMMAVMVVVLFVGYGINRHDGLRWRQYGLFKADPATMALGADRDRLEHRCGVEPAQAPLLGYCLQDPKPFAPQFAVLGDSKAEALYYGLSREAASHQAWVLIGKPNFVADMPVNAVALNRVLNDDQLKVVVLSNALRSMTPLDEDSGRMLSPPGPEKMAQWHERFSQVLQRLIEADKYPVLVLDHPTLPDPNDCIAGELTRIPGLGSLLERKANPHCLQTYAFHRTNTEAYQAFALRLQEQFPRLLVFDLAPVLCDVAQDQCAISRHGQFLYSYGDHLSDISNGQAARALYRQMEAKWPSLWRRTAP